MMCAALRTPKDHKKSIYSLHGQDGSRTGTACAVWRGDKSYLLTWCGPEESFQPKSIIRYCKQFPKHDDDHKHQVKNLSWDQVKSTNGLTFVPFKEKPKVVLDMATWTPAIEQMTAYTFEEKSVIELKLTKVDGGYKLEEESERRACVESAKGAPITILDEKRKYRVLGVLDAELSPVFYGAPSVEEPVTPHPSMDIDANGWTPFHHACAKGNVGLIKQLLNGLDINHRTNQGSTPLLLAALNGHVEAVCLLLSEGAELRALDENGRNALHLACISGDVPTIDFFLKKEFDLKSVDKQGLTPLLHAAHSGRLNAVHFLVQQLEDADLHALDESGRNALHLACISGDVPTIDFFLNRKFDLKSVDKQLLTPLLCAASNGRLNAARFLVQEGAELGARNYRGCNALHNACASGDVPTIQYFLNKKFKLESLDDERLTPLLYAALEGGPNAVKFLVQEGANIHAKADNGATAAHCAALYGDVVMLQFLKAEGCNMNQKMNNGQIPAVNAIQCGKDEAADYLLSLNTGGASSHRSMDVDADGWTVFHYTCVKGNVRLIEVQLQNGVDINHCTNIGSTPLCLAAQFGHVEAVRLLLSEGADVRAKDVKGWTAAHYAAASGDVTTLELLKANGCDLNQKADDGQTPAMIAIQDEKDVTAKYLLSLTRE